MAFGNEDDSKLREYAFLHLVEQGEKVPFGGGNAGVDDPVGMLFADAQ